MMTYSYAITFQREEDSDTPVSMGTTIDFLHILNTIKEWDHTIGSSLDVDTLEMQVTRTENDGIKDSQSHTWTLRLDK